MQGHVDTIYQASMFTLDESAPLAAGIDNDLVVIGAPANAFALDNGWLDDTVQVAGIVRRMVQVDIERDYSITLDPQIVALYQGKTAIMATAMRQLQ